jgi:hypothetical protein
MPRLTKDEESINFRCRSYGFEPKTVYILTKILLEAYRELKAGFHPNAPVVVLSPEQVTLKKQEMRRKVLRLMKKDINKFKEQQGEFIYEAVNQPWMWEKIQMLLDTLEDFRAIGPTYRLILEQAYFSGVSNDFLPETVGISDSAMEYRKRETIKLFGITIWEFCQRRENEDIVNGIIEKDDEEEDR